MTDSVKENWGKLLIAAAAVALPAVGVILGGVLYGDYEKGYERETRITVVEEKVAKLEKLDAKLDKAIDLLTRMEEREKMREGRAR